MNAARRPGSRSRLGWATTRRLNTAVAGAVLLLGAGTVPPGRTEMQPRSFELLEATVPQLQAALTAGTVTSRDLVTMYLARIDAYDQTGPALYAISVKNGNALAQADARTPSGGRADRAGRCTASQSS
jgi:hypothetical protein